MGNTAGLARYLGVPYILYYPNSLPASRGVEGALPGEPGCQARPEELELPLLLVHPTLLHGTHPGETGQTNAKGQHCWSCPRRTYQRAWDRTRISKLDEYPHPSSPCALSRRHSSSLSPARKTHLASPLQPSTTHPSHLHLVVSPW